MANMADEPSKRLKDLMARRGALIIFGPQFLEATMTLVDPARGDKAVFSAAKADELAIPDGLMIGCSLIFAHSLTWCRGRGVTQAELADWKDQLLAGIEFKPASVPGLAPEDIDEPALRFTADAQTNDLLFLAQWGPVPAKHCLDVARSLERAYARIS